LGGEIQQVVLAHAQPDVLGSGPSVRDYLAQERTLLAWIRTGVALLGFGFVVARLGALLGVTEGRAEAAAESSVDLALGLALVAVGIVVILQALITHARCVRAFRTGAFRAPSNQLNGVLIAVLLTAIGIGIGLQLLLGHARAATGRTHMENAAGLLTRPSNHSVAETLDRLEAELRAKGIAVFGRIDHSGEATKAGLSLRPTQVLVFGNPRGGTPVMQAVQTAAIELPLKALAWEDAAGKVWLSTDNPELLRRRFGVDSSLLKPLAAVGPLLDAAAR